MTQVLIVEDQQMPRQLFESFIRNSENYEIASSIRNADLADIYCEKKQIDLILMDVCTAMDANGLDASERIKKKYPHIKIIIVTSMPEFSFLDRARKIGVDSFWYKEVNEEPILKLMDRTMAGESVYPDKTPEIQFGNVLSSELKERELEVLRELTGGYTNSEIAERLGLSPNTVRDYIKSMTEKTGFRTRTELAVVARETGLVILNRKNNE